MVGVDGSLVREAHRVEVSQDEVLVKRGEGLRIDAAILGDCRVGRIRVEAEVAVDLRMDERDGHVLDGDNLVARHAEHRLAGDVCTDTPDVVRVAAVAVAVAVIIVEGVVADLRNGGVLLKHQFIWSGRCRVADRHEHSGRFGVGHHIADRRVRSVACERIGLGEHGFPSVGHSVAVGIPLRGLCSVEVVFVLIAETILIAVLGGVGRGAAGVGGGFEIGERLEDIDLTVLVDIGIFDIYDCGGYLGGSRDRQRFRRVEEVCRLIHAVRVTPALVGVARAVVVAVDERDEVDIAGLDASH